MKNKFVSDIFFDGFSSTSCSHRRPFVPLWLWEQTAAFMYKLAGKTTKLSDLCRSPKSSPLWPKRKMLNLSFLANRSLRGNNVGTLSPSVKEGVEFLLRCLFLMNTVPFLGHRWWLQSDRPDDSSPAGLASGKSFSFFSCKTFEHFVYSQPYLPSCNSPQFLFFFFVLFFILNCSALFISPLYFYLMQLKQKNSFSVEKMFVLLCHFIVV